MSVALAPLSIADVVLDYFRDRDWITGRRAAYQIGLCHGYETRAARREIERLCKHQRLQCRRSVASQGALEYRLPGPPLEPMVGEAVSPYQRMCDVLVQCPARVWTLTQLVWCVRADHAVVRLCVARLQEERVLLPCEGGFRTADIPKGSAGWWWAPGERAPLSVRRRRGGR